MKDTQCNPSNNLKLSIEDVNELLPQTQCRQCGYDGCHSYAQAIVKQEAPINFCPPGGQKGIHKLAKRLHIKPIELDPDKGEEEPLKYAFIEEKHCIGCTLCIQACPIDAIIGANKFMHTVDPELCSGCKLCIPVCPVDCIELYPANRVWLQEDAVQARVRYETRNKRLKAQAEKKHAALNAYEQQLSHETPTDHTLSSTDAKQQAIANALARARAKRKRRPSS